MVSGDGDDDHDHDDVVVVVVAVAVVAVMGLMRFHLKCQKQNISKCILN